MQRRAARAIKPEAAAGFDAAGAAQASLAERVGEDRLTRELAFARAVMAWLDAEAANAEASTWPTRYAAWALLSPEAGKAGTRDGLLFKAPHKLDSEHLRADRDRGRCARRRRDPKLPRPHAAPSRGLRADRRRLSICVARLDHAHYCIWCHNQGKDSCSSGLKDARTAAFQKIAVRRHPGGLPARGEDLGDEHPQEPRASRSARWPWSSVDNPMVAATGHRICNDCMKACIYQKQEPVDIPQVETRTLKDVLGLPWGFEIYSAC